MKLARRNLEWAGVGDNVEIVHRDIADGFCIDNADALFLDVRTPWEYLDHAVKAVKPGAMFGFLVPTVDQVSKLLMGLEKGPFADIEVCEILMRNWKPVADRLRPEDRMNAHTGFLIFCRHQERSADFEYSRPWAPASASRKPPVRPALPKAAPIPTTTARPPATTNSFRNAF